MDNEEYWYTAQTAISPVAWQEKRRNWREIYGVGFGSTLPLTHDDWRKLWQECLNAGVTVDQQANVTSSNNGAMVCFFVAGELTGPYYVRKFGDDLTLEG